MSKAQTDIRTTSYDAATANPHGYTGTLDDVLKQLDAEPQGPLAVAGSERRELLHFLGVDKSKFDLSGVQKKALMMPAGYIYGYVTFDDDLDHVEYGAPEQLPEPNRFSLAYAISQGWLPGATP